MPPKRHLFSNLPLRRTKNNKKIGEILDNKSTKESLLKETTPFVL